PQWPAPSFPTRRSSDLGARQQFAGLEPGGEIRLGPDRWRVVGVFESGDAMESEIWGDAGIVATTYRRGSSRNSLTVRLTGPEALDRKSTRLNSSHVKIS